MGEQERYDVLNVLDFTRYVDILSKTHNVDM